MNRRKKLQGKISVYRFLLKLTPSRATVQPRAISDGLIRLACKRANSWEISWDLFWSFSLKKLRASEQWLYWSAVSEILGGKSTAENSKGFVLWGVEWLPAEEAAMADFRRHRGRFEMRFPSLLVFLPLVGWLQIFAGWLRCVCLLLTQRVGRELDWMLSRLLFSFVLFFLIFFFLLLLISGFMISFAVILGLLKGSSENEKCCLIYKWLGN